MRRLSGWLRLTLLIGGVAALFLVASAVTSSETADNAAIRQVVNDGVIASRELPVTAAKLTADGPVAAFHTDADARLDNLYSGAALRHQQEIIARNLGKLPNSADATGLSSIRFTKIDVGDTNAAVTAEVDTWNNWTQSGHASYLYTFKLVKTDVGWRISDEIFESAPGNEH